MSKNWTRTDTLWLDAQYHQNGQIRKPNEVEGELQDPPGEIDKTVLDRVHGSIAGMALGDALGAHVEGRPREFLVQNPVKDLKGGGTWGLNKGEFTDDTSMALCLASSLVIRRDFIPYDQLVRYKWWFRNGYMSVTGKCFDIDADTKKSLIEFERRQRDFAQKNNILEDMDSFSDPQLLREFNVDCSNKEVAGNGALMRLAPVPLFFHNFPKIAVEFSGVSGRITHGDESAYDACRYYGALIVAALEGRKKKELLDDRFYIENKELFSNKKQLHPEIIRIAEGSYKRKRGYDDGIRGKGYIVFALEAALWAFWSTKDFETGALAAVNLGDDTDTTAAIYGQLAGAYYGFEQLPVRWLECMYARRFIECLSKWIVFEGQRWQPKKSVNVIIDNPASQGQSNTTTNSSAKQNKNSDAQTTASQRAGGTKPESKHPNPTQYQDGSPFHASRTSPFYDACRANDIDLVENYMESMSVEQINQIEPNGSTALHVAAYQGHQKIVELLLQKGASCSIINKYKCTPLDEAKTDRIKQLIRRRMNQNRFISDSVEWIFPTNDADFQAHEYLKILELYGKDRRFHKFIAYIRENYLENELGDVDGIDTIKEYFDMAINEKDPDYLLTAYTADTGFYSTLNFHLAQLQLDRLTDKKNLSRAYYVGLIARHPKFEKLSFVGQVFRGMIIIPDDLKKYKVGTRILTKTFSSASKQRDIASTFHGKNAHTNDRLSTICIYQIRNERTALAIQHLSLFEYEEEVLILPYSAFNIIAVKQNKDCSPQVEIKLRECEPWVEDY